MRKYISLGLSVLVSVAIFSSCNRVSNIPLTQNINKTTSSYTEFNAFGHSTKKVTLSLKKAMTQDELKKFVASHKAKIVEYIPELNIVVVEYINSSLSTTGTVNSASIINAFSTSTSVEKSEPVKLVRIESENDSQNNFKTAGILSDLFSSTSTNQYFIDKINLKQAWNITMGDPKIKVAVVDSGVDLNHPDLKGHLVDGIDVIDNETPPDDDYGHGTHVTGLIVANGDSNVTGVAPKCSVIPIRVLKNGVGTDIDIAKGIIIAVKKGASVINVSIGLYEESEAMERAVKYALENNVPVVSSAGNSAQNSTIHMPSMVKGVIEVSSTDKDDNFSKKFSNFNQQISVSAPGDSIYSLMPTYKVTLTSDAGGTKYGTLSGTSMSTPIVSGIVALMKTKNKSLTPAKIKSILEQSSVDLGKTGYDGYYGYGRVDAYKALSAVK